ncbi:MAG: PilN domain-containing protein [Candidatus Eisenbacteria bacterium]|nr:PilN domain-containing protein [Candidatus Eisenbacteria bacterium]
MIRVNLLPREGKAQRKPVFSIKAGDLVVPAVILAAAAVVVSGTVISQASRVSSLTRSIAEVDAQSRALAPQIARVQRLAQERAELDLRLGVINKLEQGRTQSVRLMDELARCVPDHLWLSGASEEASGTLGVEGVTFSNLVVSDFMSRLERSPMFAHVELEYAEHALQTDRDVVKFRVSCKLTPDETAN